MDDVGERMERYGRFILEIRSSQSMGDHTMTIPARVSLERVAVFMGDSEFHWSVNLGSKCLEWVIRDRVIIQHYASYVRVASYCIPMSR